MMPGVQNPHWLPPVATEASAHRSATTSGEPVEGGDRRPGHPPRGGHAGHAGRAVDQHRAAAALALGAAPVLGACACPGPSRSTSSSDTPTIGHRDRAPSTVSESRPTRSAGLPRRTAPGSSASSVDEHAWGRSVAGTVARLGFVAMPPSTQHLSRRAMLLGAAGAGRAAALGALLRRHRTRRPAARPAPALAGDPHTKDPIVIPLFDVSDPYVVTGSEQRLAARAAGRRQVDRDRTRHPAATVTIRHRGDELIGSPITVAAPLGRTPDGLLPVAHHVRIDRLPTRRRSPSTAARAVRPSTWSAPVRRPRCSSAASTCARSTRHRRPTTAASSPSAPGCPVCPLHDITLDAGPGTPGKPIAFLVATPQFCQVGVCGPVARPAARSGTTHPTIQFLHAEVYTRRGQGRQHQAPRWPRRSRPTTSPTSRRCSSPTADGTLVERLDNVFDRRDLASGPEPGSPESCRELVRSAEGLAAAAGALGVRVVDGEARRPAARPCSRAWRPSSSWALEGSTTTLTPVLVDREVVVGRVGVEEHLVAEAGAPTGAHGDTEHQRVVALVG